MKTTISNRAVIFFVAAIATAIVGVACSSNNSSGTGGNGTGASVPVGPASSSTSTGTGGSTSSSSTTGTGGTTSSSSSTGSGCFDGGATTNDQFINGCPGPGSMCSGTFDNSSLPGLAADGGLPPLN